MDKFIIWKKHTLLGTMFATMLVACGGGGGGAAPGPTHPPSNTTLTRDNAMQLFTGTINANVNLAEVMSYSILTILGDLTLNPSDTTPTTGVGLHGCYQAGTFEIAIQDTNGDGRISAGESGDVTFSDCVSTVSNPINGSIHQNLISFDADFPPDSLFATTIRSWDAEYTYSNLTRIDSQTGAAYLTDGNFAFTMHQRTDGTAGTTYTIVTHNLIANGMTGNSTLVDLSITGLTDATTNTQTLTGSFIDPTMGLVTITAGMLTDVGLAAGATMPFLGNLTLQSGVSILDITLNNNSIDFKLDTFGDGSMIDTWTVTSQ
jgi:hypothetical protein